MISVRLRSDHQTVREMMFRELPVRIGRGADNDFIIGDDSVSINHAVIDRDEEGHIRLTDLKSRNGTRVANIMIESVPIRGIMHCYLGVVEMEFEEVSKDVTREVSIREWEQFNRRRTLRHHVRYVLFGVAAWVFYVLIEPQFWSPWKESRQVPLLWNILAALIFIPTTSFFLLMILRAVGRKVRIADTLEAFSNVIWMFPALGLVSVVCYYIVPTGWWVLLVSAVGGAAFVVAVVYLASIRRIHQSRAFQIGWAISAAIILMGSVAIRSVSQRQEGAPNTDYVIYPPIGGFTGSTTSFEAYLNDVKKAALRASKNADQIRTSR